MNLWESAIMSGMVPRAGRHPSPSCWTNSFTALSITQNEVLWNTTVERHVAAECNKRRMHAFRRSNTYEVCGPMEYAHIFKQTLKTYFFV